MNVFLISQGQDIGGQSARIAAAFKRHEPGWNVRSMHVARTYIQYPYDLEWDPKLALEMYRQADVVHHQNWLYSYAAYDGKQRKPAVVHHHGPPLRTEAARINREAKSVGAVQLVSTVDLLADAPSAKWLPNFYDIAALRVAHPRKAKRPNAPIRIGHAPTVRAMKGTEAILASLKRVGRRHDIDVDLVEGVTWHESLERKAACDIYVDQLTLGYGLSAIECMALGTPVIAGWEDPNDRELFIRQTGQTPPFIESGASDLDARLEDLITSADERRRVAVAGAKFVEKFHDESAGVKRLKAIYESAPRTRGINAMQIYGDIPKQIIARRFAA